MKENNDLARLAQEQEERCTIMILSTRLKNKKSGRTMTIDFKFPRGLNNSATMFQTAIRQPTTTNPIDGPA
jgi:hypothetical protein